MQKPCEPSGGSGFWRLALATGERHENIKIPLTADVIKRFKPDFRLLRFDGKEE